MSDVPQVGYRVVQITHQEPIPKEDKKDFPWVAVAILLFGLLYGSNLPSSREATIPQAASSARR